MHILKVVSTNISVYIYENCDYFFTVCTILAISQSFSNQFKCSRQIMKAEDALFRLITIVCPADAIFM